MLGRILALACKFVLYTFCVTLAIPPQVSLLSRIKVDKPTGPNDLLDRENSLERKINFLHKKGTSWGRKSMLFLSLPDVSAEGYLGMLRDEKNDRDDKSSGGISLCNSGTKNSRPTPRIILSE